MGRFWVDPGPIRVVPGPLRRPSGVDPPTPWAARPARVHPREDAADDAGPIRRSQTHSRASQEVAPGSEVQTADGTTYTVMNLLGQGTFAKVYRCVANDTQEPRARACVPGRMWAQVSPGGLRCVARP